MSAVDESLQKRRLINRAIGEDALGEARAFLGTTFDFQPDFFETDYLPTLLGLGAWDDRAWSSRIALEKKLAHLESATVFAEASRYQGRPRSLRVEHVPVSVGAGRKLHAKVNFIAYEGGCRLIVSSANLTAPGYRSNRECAAVFTVTPADRRYAPVMRQALEGMRSALAPWWTDGAERAARLCMEWASPEDAAFADDAQLIWSGGGVALLERFVDVLPAEAIERIDVVSPFWPQDDGQDFLSASLGRLRAEGRLADNSELHLMSEAWPEAEGVYSPVLPQTFGAYDFSALGIRAFGHAVDPTVLPEEVEYRKDFIGKRSLHAKTLIARGATSAVAYIGSANFTRRGWSIGLPGAAANIEAGLLLRVPADDKRLASLLPGVTGAAVNLDGSAEARLVAPIVPESTAPWPTFVKSIALLVREGAAEELALSVDLDGGSIKGDWRILLPPEIGDEGPMALLEGGPESAAHHTRALTAELLRRLLKYQEAIVQWWGNTEGRAFPINVSLAARDGLPIAPGAGDPREHHLIAYYQGRIAWEDLFPDPEDSAARKDLEKQAAPDSGVDTSSIQSYQIREFVEALRGIQDDLRLATGSPAAMRLALFGPVSPIQLARVVAEAVRDGQRTPVAGGFQLVEILRCLREARRSEVAAQHISEWFRLLDKAESQVAAFLDDVAQADGQEMGPATPFGRYRSAILAPPEEVAAL